MSLHLAVWQIGNQNSRDGQIKRIRDWSNSLNCIGVIEPVSVMVNTYGTGKLSDRALATLVRQVFSLSPKGMIDHLNLRRRFI
jgi:hypothetical protein